MSAEDFFVPENKAGEPKLYKSLSGRYTLTVQAYKTKPGCWNYSQGVVSEDDRVIATIQRNYGTFHHGFFRQGETEWMVCGRSYMSQTFVNLSNGKVYDGEIDKSEFCWSNIHPNPSGTLLLVVGCVWGAPYEYVVYDVSAVETSGVWKQVPLMGDHGVDVCISEDDLDEVKWEDDHHLVIKQAHEDDSDDASSVGKKVVTNVNHLHLQNGYMLCTEEDE